LSKLGQYHQETIAERLKCEPSLTPKVSFHQVIPMNVMDTSHCRSHRGCQHKICPLADSWAVMDITQDAAT